MLMMDIASRAALLLAAAGLGTLLLRRSVAATRALVWGTSLVCILALPLLGRVVPELRVPILLAVQERASLEGDSADTASGVVKPLGSASEALATRSSSLERANTSNGRIRSVSSSHTTVARGSEGRPPRRFRELQIEGGRPRSAAGAATSGMTSSVSGRLAPLVATIVAFAKLVDRLADAARSVGFWRVLLVAWAVGVSLLIARLAVGVGRVAWLARRAKRVTSGALYERSRQVAAELGVRSPVVLLETSAAVVPVVCHWVRPHLLVPPAMRDWSAERQRVVLLHELAHVRRHDCRLQLFAYLSVALHWFNPMAWLALRRLGVERERACDDIVLQAGVRPSAYADHLVAIARASRSRWLGGQVDPALAAAMALFRPSRLAGRVSAILDPSVRRQSPNRRTNVSVLAFAAVVLLPLAAIQPVPAIAISQQAPAAPIVMVQAPPSPTAGAPAAQPTQTQSAAPAPLASESHSVPTAAPLPPGIFPSPAPSGVPLATVAPTPIAQSGEPTIDELVQMRIHGVTPEYIEGITTMMGRPPVIKELIQMRIHGVTPEYAEEMRQAFGDGLELDDLVQGRIHGASPEAAAALRSAFGDELRFKDVIQARIHGVSAEYSGRMAELLREDLAFKELIQMRIHGVTAEAIEGVTVAFGRTPSAEEMVQVRIHGVSAEYADGMRAVFGNQLELDDLVQGRIHGLDGDYARGMRNAFGDGLEFDDLVQGRIHGVSSEFAGAMAEQLSGELAFRDLVQMRIHGVDEEMIRELEAAGYDDRTADELVRIKIHGMERIMARRGRQQ